MSSLWGLDDKPTRELIQDPRPAGLLEILTVACTNRTYVGLFGVL